MTIKTNTVLQYTDLDMSLVTFLLYYQLCHNRVFPLT